LQAVCIVLIIIGTILASFKLKDLHKLDPKKAVKGSGYAILSMFAWGVSLFLGVILIGYLGWFFPVFFIYVILLVYNIIYFFARGMKFKKIGKNMLPVTALIGIAATFGFLTYTYGVAASQLAVIVAPISGAAPVLTVILAFVLLKEKLDINQKAGVLLILFSIIAISVG
jgi:drug/metabolite transporter (DMT)-like permease